MSCPYYALLFSALLASTWAAEAQEPPHQEWVDRAVQEVILPAYDDFAREAELLRTSVESLCDHPGPEGRETSRESFRTAVQAFARIEPYRFGPARVENRFERLFFWPDPRGRGLRQVQGVLGSSDSSVLTMASLQQKSVALQGMPALDFILSGTDADVLDGPEGAFRCGYGLAVAQNIEAIAQTLSDEWSGAEGYAALLSGSGPENDTYRNAMEALQEIHRAVREQLQLVLDFKIAHVIRDSQPEGRPRRAVLWRSEASLDMMIGNIETVRDLMSIWPVTEGDWKTGALKEQMETELRNAIEALERARGISTDIAAVIESEEGYTALQFATHPLYGAFQLMNENIPAALGLAVGFNSTDGD